MGGWKEELDGMSLEELRALEIDVIRAISDELSSRRREAIAAARAAAEAYGFSLEELIGAQPGNFRVKRKVRYRHPENSELTWTGRGRQPNWFKEAIQSGFLLEDLKVS